MLMEIETKFCGVNISLCFPRFLPLPQSGSARFFFFFKDDERLRGETVYLPVLPLPISLLQLKRNKYCLVN